MIATLLAALSIDEVGMDLGQDEHSQGLLDEWTGGTDEESHERTGTLSLDALAEQRQAPLSRLGLDPTTHEVPKHIQALKLHSIEGMKTMLQEENLDPLPLLERCRFPNQSCAQTPKKMTSQAHITVARFPQPFWTTGPLHKSKIPRALLPHRK